MDRLFLDANILFSAAYRPNAGLLEFWKLPDATLFSSRYALEEARVNLSDEAQRQRLASLVGQMEFFDVTSGALPRDTALPEKDAPILLAAMAARPSHLITGDVRHFGSHFGKTIEGILVLPPGDYLSHRRTP